MRKTNRIQCIEPFALAVALGLAGLNGCARFSGDPPSRPIALTLLHTNDTHSHLEPFPRDDELSAGNQGPQQGGIARRKTLIDAVRASEPNVLLVDAGDHFQGTIFHNAWKGSAEIMALNALSYDAITLGNHEFDRGPAELGRALRGEPVEIAGTVYPVAMLLCLGFELLSRRDVDRHAAKTEWLPILAIFGFPPGADPMLDPARADHPVLRLELRCFCPC